METLKELKIEIPKGHEIASFDMATGQIKFKVKNQNVLERITTVPDVLADNDISPLEFDLQCSGFSADERAYKILKLLAKSLNEGWVPDWSNSNEYKYYPWFEMRGSSGFRFYVFVLWGSHSLVGSRLCFKTRALAEHAGKNFLDVYKSFMVID